MSKNRPRLTDWVFIVFSVGTFVYAFSIVKDYMVDARIQTTLQEALMAERAMLETQILKQEREQEAAKAKIQEVRKFVKEFQDLAHKREAEIKRFEDEMAKRGKYRL